jgi:hypothetical protein
MRAWVSGLRLDPADFAARFFNRAPGSPAVEHLRQAAQIVAGATTNGAMRDATDQLAAGMQAVGLDHWSRFLKDAQDRADASPLVQPVDDGMRQTAPPPLDPNRSFVIDHRYFSALARVQATRPRLGTAEAPAPILPPGQYRPGLDSLVRRIAGAQPGDQAQLYADITALYMQPGAHRTGETLIRAVGDAIDAGANRQTRQDILDGIAPIAEEDPEKLAGEEMGLPAILLGGTAGVLPEATVGAEAGAAAKSEVGVDEAAPVAPVAITPQIGPPNWIPRSVVERIPRIWGDGIPSRKGVGWRWANPSYNGDRVRIDQGESEPLVCDPARRSCYRSIRWKGNWTERKSNKRYDTTERKAVSYSITRISRMEMLEQTTINTTLQFPDMRINLCACLKSLSNNDYQQRVWVRGEPEQEVDDFTEVVNILYDDLGLSPSPHSRIGEILLNANEADYLKKLLSLLDRIFETHGLDLTDAAYIALPEWPQVIECAQAARRLICPL